MEEDDNYSYNQSNSMNEEETHKKKYKTVLCEIHNTFIHGFDKNSDPSIFGHYLVIEKFYNIFRDLLHEDEEEEEEDEEEEDENSWLDDLSEDNPCIDDVLFLYNQRYEDIRQSIYNSTFLRYRHPIIRNYDSIIGKPDYLKPEIAECIYLDTGECICILKTFWLRLIQRTWRKIFKQRRHMFQIRHTLKSLRYREMYGKWPIACNNMPTIHGMLSYLL